MSSSAERARPSARRRRELLTEGRADDVVLARLGEDVHASPYITSAHAGAVDPRLVDHRLEPAFRAALECAIDEARATGRAEGYADGLAEARRQAGEVAAAEAERLRQLDAERAAAVQRACVALDRAAAVAQSALAPTLSAIEELSLETAMQLVLLLLGRALPDEERVIATVHRALAMTDVGTPLVVRLHPHDAAIVDATLRTAAAGPSRRNVTFVADESAAPGSCVVEDGDAHIDASLLAALGRVRDALSVAPVAASPAAADPAGFAGAA